MLMFYEENPWSTRYPELISYVTTANIPDGVWMRQVHGSQVAYIASSDKCWWKVDALVTDQREIWLKVYVADCGNLYAYDPVAYVIGICHAGWRWTHTNIIWNMIAEMIQLGAKNSQIRIRMGPSISAKNYEFWPEVTNLFEKKYYNKIWNTYYLDLPKLHTDQLIQAGIQEKYVNQSSHCTFWNLQLPSYRRDKSYDNKLYGLILMKS